MSKKFTWLLIFSLFYNNPFAQSNFQNPTQLSLDAGISILTIDRADDELFQAFGHIAIFINDPVNQIDRVYGYGAFDFRTDNFYWKFITGQLPYQISVSNIQNTLLEYSEQYENRSITKQDLVLSAMQKQRVFDILEENYLPENRTYQYKFFQDNCSTRIRDVFKNALGDSLKFTQKGIEQGRSYRYWMNSKLPNTPWARFGMNLAIGNPSDKPNTNEETFYLPDNMRIAFENATNGNKPIVGRTLPLFTAFRPNTAAASAFSPILVFTILLVIGLILSYLQYKNNSKSILFDQILLVSTGLLGVLIVFLWFFTVHGVTMYNWNLLWALPTNLILAFMLKSSNKYLKYYLTIYQAILLISIGLGLGFGFFIAEIYPWAILPLLILLIIRISLLKINIISKN